jgi:hypothetical protein
VKPQQMFYNYNEIIIYSLHFGCYNFGEKFLCPFLLALISTISVLPHISLSFPGHLFIILTQTQRKNIHETWEDSPGNMQITCGDKNLSYWKIPNWLKPFKTC